MSGPTALDPAGLALLGAHCDDVAIGAGATLLGLCTARPGLRVDVLVLTGGGTAREDEERVALAAFCPGAQLAVTVLDLPDGRVPTHWERAKEAVRAFRGGLTGDREPDLVLAPAGHDAHQDHRTLAALVPTEFRTHQVLGYEILKWESDLAQPRVLVPASESDARAKPALLHEHYPSQRARTWFDDDAFLGLMRVRGVQAGTRFAEGFHAEKVVLAPRPAPQNHH
ncbi:PIG-L family deacetylase [Rhodococcus aerolatus]